MVDKNVYSVSHFYSDAGCVQKLTRSPHFHNLVMAMIFGNAIYLGVDSAQGERAEENPVFIAGNNFFCFFFVGELLLRFVSFRFKSDCLKDNWFKFDLFLVVLMVLETWLIPPVVHLVTQKSGKVETGPIRLVRLLRLARMTRIMKAFPELMTMLKGMRLASRAVGSSILLLCVMIYVFAIAIFTFTKDQSSVSMFFGSLTTSMLTLLIDGTFMDSIGTILRLFVDNGLHHCALIFMAFVFLSAMTVMNMLIGVLCEVVSAVAASEREEAAINLMRETVLVALRTIDKDGSGTISKDELLDLLNDQHSLDVLHELHVDTLYMLELKEMLFSDGRSNMTIRSVMDMILKCRGDRPVLQQDLVDLFRFIRFMVRQTASEQEVRLVRRMHHMAGHFQGSLRL